MTPVIAVDRLTRRYGDQVAVEDVSVTVEPGEIFGIIGPNGAGRTTTLECVQGIRTPDRGAMRVLGLYPSSRLPRCAAASVPSSSSRPSPTAFGSPRRWSFFVIWMLSGAAPPRAVLPPGVQDAGEMNPLTHVVIAIQDPWFGYGWNGEKLLILVLVTLAAAGIGLRRFRWG